MATKISELYRKWQKKENNAIQTKTGAGFDEILKLNTRPIVAGKYRIQWNAEARLQSGNTSVPKIRVTVGGVQRGLNSFKSPDQDWSGWSGWDFQSFNEGDTPEILMEVQRNGGTDTVEVRRLKLSIELMEE